MPKPKRKLTAAQRRAKRERKQKFMTIFINGKQKRVPRPQLIDGMTEDEYILRNADPIWLHVNEMWEYLRIDDTDLSSQGSQSEWLSSSENPF